MLSYLIFAFILCQYYYNPQLDPQFSLAIPPGSVPMMAFRQIKENKLGPPYSNCTQNTKLKYYNHYTSHH